MQPAAAPVFFAAAVFLNIVLIRSACFNFGGASGSQRGKVGELPVTVKEVMKDTDNDDVAISPSTQSWRPTACLMAHACVALHYQS